MIHWPYIARVAATMGRLALNVAQMLAILAALGFMAGAAIYSLDAYIMDTQPSYIEEPTQ